MTGEEHLYLFAGLRNIPKDKIAEESYRLLKEVDLQDVGKTRSSMYSGGMRRRLSVAISLIGNPKIIFLDEPVCFATVEISLMFADNRYGSCQQKKSVECN